MTGDAASIFKFGGEEWSTSQLVDVKPNNTVAAAREQGNRRPLEEETRYRNQSNSSQFKPQPQTQRRVGVVTVE
jgi:hypothetical protein